MQSKLLSGNAWRLRLNAPVAQRTEQGASNASTGVRLFSGVPKLVMPVYRSGQHGRKCTSEL